MTKAGKTVDFMTISPDSIRFNINNDNTKSVKGGFAVGGYDLTKSKGPINQDFMYLTPQTSNSGQFNTFLGFQSGYNNQSGGLYNSFIGYNSGYNNSTGIYNVFLGYLSGFTNSTGGSNVFIGNESGYYNTTGSANVFLGISAGKYNTTGERGVKIGERAGLFQKVGEGSIFIGYEAGSGYQDNSVIYEVTAQNNVFIGTYTGKKHLTGNNNTFVGDRSGIHTKGGERNTYIGSEIQCEPYISSNPDDNVYIGYNVAQNNQNGDRNVMIGTQAGLNSGQSGSGLTPESSGSVFIGYQAGYNETGSNKLYIDNSSTAAPLIYGDFTDTSEKLVFNGNVGINISPTHLIHLSGGAYSDGATWTNSSDINLKENFEPVNGEIILNLVDQLSVTRWNYKTDNPAIKHIGPVAQDFYSLFGLGNNDLSISTIDPSGVALVAIKELSRQNNLMKEQIESTQKENLQLKSELQSLREEMDQIKEMLEKGDAR